MELEQTESTLIEEPAMMPINIQYNNGELLLNNEKISIAEEIKILIRKLWN